MLDELIRDITVLPVTDLKKTFVNETGTDRKFELAFINWKLVRGIKDCTFKCINRTNDILIYERVGEQVIRLFDALSDDVLNKGLKLMPVEYRHETEIKGDVAKVKK